MHSQQNIKKRDFTILNVIFYCRQQYSVVKHGKKHLPDNTGIFPPIEDDKLICLSAMEEKNSGF